MRCDAPLHKKSRVGSDEEEEGRDMESFEVNYVWVYTTLKLTMCEYIPLLVNYVRVSLSVNCVRVSLSSV